MDTEQSMEAYSDANRELELHLSAFGSRLVSSNTPLMYACANGNVETVRELIKDEVNVEAFDKYGHTPLMKAAIGGHVRVAKILVEHGADINTSTDVFKESPLTLASYNGRVPFMKFLLNAGVNKEHQTDEMHTALMETILGCQLDATWLLLYSGAQVRRQLGCLESPLTMAAYGGHVQHAILLLSYGADVEEVNDKGHTPLIIAVRKEYENMILLLLRNGAKINVQIEGTLETPLILACRGGFYNVVDILMKNGANLELGESTPLMEAAKEGHIDIVGYLLEFGANLHAQNSTGDTALTYACENGRTSVANILLLAYGSESVQTLLMNACEAGHYRTVKFLLTKNVDINKVSTENGHTPLSLACAKGRLKVVKLLLANSADMFHKLKDNSTIFFETAKNGHSDVVKLLLNHIRSGMFYFKPYVSRLFPLEEDLFDELYALNEDRHKVVISGGAKRERSPTASRLTMGPRKNDDKIKKQ